MYISFEVFSDKHSHNSVERERVQNTKAESLLLDLMLLHKHSMKLRQGDKEKERGGEERLIHQTVKRRQTSK